MSQMTRLISRLTSKSPYLPDWQIPPASNGKRIGWRWKGFSLLSPRTRLRRVELDVSVCLSTLHHVFVVKYPSGITLCWGGYNGLVLIPASRSTVTTGTAALRPSARSQLPQELQLYFTRLTTALIPTLTQTADPSALSEAERHRLAALESLRQDTAIGGILAYIVKWFAESIQKSLVGPTGVGWALLQGLESLLRNDSVFLEPYVSVLPCAWGKEDESGKEQGC